jgi:hypothetical protein
MGTWKRFALGTLAAAASVLVLAAPASAAIRYADDTPSGVGPCTDPQEPCDLMTAITVSGLYDEIQIGGGSYPDPYTLTGGQSLVGANFQNGGVTAGEAVIDGGGTSIRLDGSGITTYTVRGLTILGGTGVLAQNADPGGLTVNLIDNVFDGSGATGPRVDLEALIGDGPISATIEGNDFAGSAPDLNVDRRGIESSFGNAANVINLTARNNHFEGYSMAINGIHGVSEITGNRIEEAYDPNGEDIPAIRLNNAVGTVTDNTIDSYVGAPIDRGVSLSHSTAASADTVTIERLEARGMVRQAVYASGNLGGDKLIIRDSLLAPIGNEAPVNATNHDGGLELEGVTVPENASGFSVDTVGTPVSVRSSILGDSIDTISPCTVAFSRGPTTSGDSCETFQTSATPGFVDGPNGDFRLAAASPLIDAGDPGSVGTKDLTGAPRTQDGNGDGIAVRDMGAYELADTFAPKTTFTAQPPASIKVKVKKPKKPKKGKKRKKAKKPKVGLSYAFTSNEAGAKFECSFDGAAFVPCAGSYATTTGLGTHTLAVRATDAFGNTSAPVSAAVTVSKKKAKKKKKKKKK